MSVHNAMQHDGGPYLEGAAHLAKLRELAGRDGLPANADLVNLAERTRGVSLDGFTKSGVSINGRRYFVGEWAVVGGDEDGPYATDVRFIRSPA